MKPIDRAWRVRQVTQKDQDLVDGLLAAARWQHRHLDWAQIEDLLGRQPYLLASEHGLPLALLACPPDPPGVAWIRLFAVASGYEVMSTWELLWERARAALQEMDVKQAAALSIPPWLPEPLESVGFEEIDSVVFLEWTLARPPEAPELDLATEPLVEADLPAVAELDRRAFQPLWSHSIKALQLALKEAAYARVTRAGADIIGYQISTSSSHGGHLARLAVEPSEQGRGVATALVIDVLRHFHGLHLPRVTVNTQGSNERGQALYERLGFRPTGQVFPVLQRRIGA